jgi:hypothetical protein
MTMGLFTKNPPNTISDKEWAKLQRGAGKTYTREGGIFGKRAAERRHLSSRNLARKNEN